MHRERASWRAAAGLLLGAVLSACTRQDVPDPVASGSAVVAVNPAVAVYEKSIAVLPFTDLSERGDQEYFSDGLSEDLINKLAMLPELQVAGRESSFHYKGVDAVLSDAGRALGVAYILQGTVRKSGERLRVSAQLVNVGTGFNVWSRSFDRELADAFVIRDEIAEAVTDALSVTLGAGRFDVPGMTRDVAAFDKAMQAVASFNGFTPDAVFEALNQAEEALRLDPRYGRAWILLGSIYEDGQLILSADQAADFPALAQQAFDQARSVAPDMPELLLVDARNFREAGRFYEAEQIYLGYFERYRSANARAMEDYALLLSSTGRISEAIVWLKQARRQEPFELRYSFQLAMHLLLADRIEEALAEAEHGMTLDGSRFLIHSVGWQAALKQGDLAHAADLIREYYASFSEARDDTASRRFMLSLSDILLINDFEASSEQIIALIRSPSATPVELAYLARVAALMGHPEVALDYWFGEQVGPGIWDSYYAGMRRLPDFKVLLEESGVAGYWRSSGNWADKCRPEGADFSCN